MEFDLAANRLKKDHDELRNRAKRRPQSLASTKATLEAKKRQEYRKKQLEKKKHAQRIQKLKLDYARRGFDIMEQKLGVLRNLSGAHVTASNASSGDNGITLEATSVHGQGDKITLPPSLLSTLANRDLLRSSQERGQPLFFRLGIRRPNYVFPASDKMKAIRDEFVVKEERHNFGKDRDYNNESESMDFTDSVSMLDDLDDDDDDDSHKKLQKLKWEEAYLEELSHEYVSYVYATVIEFTQEEGHIGLPQCMATALLQPKFKSNDNDDTEEKSLLDSKVTIDPASNSTTSNMNSSPMDIEKNRDNNNNNINEEIPKSNNGNDNEDTLESKTPGHPAYGLFPIPKHPIEITLLTHLPLGTKCTLQPTTKAIHDGFYNLKDVKLVLEQSFIRTRGCLNLNDVVHCWHRGKKFDLEVKDVLPSHVGAVSCVNTDVEVDIAAAVEYDNSMDTTSNALQKDANIQTTNSMVSSQSTSTGYRLKDDPPPSSSSTTTKSTTTNVVRQIYQALKATKLPEEPPSSDQNNENIITVQIRGEKGKQCRRRFDTTTSQIGDLFVLAVQEQVVPPEYESMNESSISNGFRLVTRFPRRVFTLESDGETVLSNASLSKQELFMIEKL